VIDGTLKMAREFMNQCESYVCKLIWSTMPHLVCYVEDYCIEKFTLGPRYLCPRSDLKDLDYVASQALAVVEMVEGCR
jgi:hypothetical protein